MNESIIGIESAVTANPFIGGRMPFHKVMEFQIELCSKISGSALKILPPRHIICIDSTNGILKRKIKTYFKRFCLFYVDIDIE